MGLDHRHRHLHRRHRRRGRHAAGGGPGATGVSLDDISFASEGFFFILDTSGHVVVAPAERDLSPLGGTPEGQAVVRQIEAAAPTVDGQITSLDVEAALPPGGPRTWALDVSTFQPLGWILVSAVPASALEAPGRVLALRQAALSLVVLLIGLGSGLLLSRRILRPVEALTNAARDLSNDRFDPATLDEAAQRQDELGQLARSFQRMGVDVVSRERTLRDQVARLTVEIDRAKVDKSVGEIVESDYFQRIQQRADEFRRRYDED